MYVNFNYNSLHIWLIMTIEYNTTFIVLHIKLNILLTIKEYSYDGVN